MSRIPKTWDEYQYGTSGSHRGSVSSAGGRSIRFDEQTVGSPSASSALLDAPGERSESDQHGELRRRRSSIGLHLNSIAQIGGVNSIENFARSWTRAAAFDLLTPHRPSFILQDDQDRDEEGTIQYGRSEYGHMPRTSLLRAHLEANDSPEVAVDDDSELDPNTPRPLDHRESEGRRLGAEFGSMQGSVRGSNIGSVRAQSIFAIAPHLATPLAGSYDGTGSYGTLRSSLNESSMVHAGQLWRQQQANRAEGDREPLLVKEVEQGGKVVLVVAGQSTLPQTVFNSTNVLIGVGLLSLPMGLKYSGWICGMVFLLLSAIVTAYTAKLLAKCMDCDAGLITFADLAYVSYGQKARIATSVLFTLELLAACVALVVLFADTLDLLIPGVGVIQWKILCGILLIPLNFAPLRLLSFSSVIGIFSCFSIVLIVFVDGFIKPHTPGSLREPAETYLFPNNWLTLPLSFGLLMSPWGGHSVFPNIYRDMRHPYKFKKAVKITFTFTYLLDCATAVAGILMFGEGVMNEITANIIDTSSYPRALSILMSIFIAIIPLTKVPLNARPIVSTIEVFSGLDPVSISDSPALTGLPSYTRGILKVAIRVIVVIVFVIISIVFPAFDSIMAFMGSTLCFTICVILPLMFYLKIFGKEVSVRERIFCYFLIAISSVLAIVGTVWAFLPKSMIGAE
ncbi:transmembrane amino acid transporter [Mollisia scopiformis]|uniref:Transmembrane amino acid transporter n=1 Tax=Mollisia scopiformis TaxID=149040 RepID=A0A194WVR0_MOLSC|nr:transmembrane amino acid transporter [Mollisia scopiformis]KUJ11764.1 transmembrane amino acid transporter [Mollisia scopiformis]